MATHAGLHPSYGNTTERMAEVQRQKDEQAERAAQWSGVSEARFAALERRIDKRLKDIEEALVLAFGDLRREFDAQFAEQSERSLSVDQRAEMVRLSRQVRQCLREVEELRQDVTDERGKGLRAVK